MPGINRQGNTKNVLKTAVKKRPDFPALSPGSQGRIFTKHFTNLLTWLDHDSISLLGFLVYQSDMDNTVDYSTKLLRHYAQYVVYLERYGSQYIRCSVPLARGTFKKLIQEGILLPTETIKRYMVNPNLTYSNLAVKSKFYNTWTMLYRSGTEIETLTKMYIKHVNEI